VQVQLPEGSREHDGQLIADAGSILLHRADREPERLFRRIPSGTATASSNSSPATPSISGAGSVIQAHGDGRLPSAAAGGSP